MISTKLAITRLPLYSALVTFMLSAACVTPSHSKTEVMGTPPPPNEDPFAVAIPLSEYDEAPTSGLLNGDDVEEMYTSDTAISSLASPQPFENTSKSAYSTKKNDHVNEIKARPETPPKPTHTYHCYSCIGVCIHGPEKTACKNEKDELCGWGSSKDLRSAQLMATEQCRGSLLKYTPVTSLPSEGATCSVPYCE